MSPSLLLKPLKIFGVGRDPPRAAGTSPRSNCPRKVWSSLQRGWLVGMRPQWVWRIVSWTCGMGVLAFAEDRALRQQVEASGVGWIWIEEQARSESSAVLRRRVDWMVSCNA